MTQAQRNAKIILSIKRLWENGTRENELLKYFRRREIIHAATDKAVQAFKAAYRQ